MASIAILTSNNGAGLARSGRLLAHPLEDHGHTVRLHDFDDAPPGHHRYDLVIFLERIVESWLAAAPRLALVPNQEWFDPETIACFPRMHAALCKTRHAERLFRERGVPVYYIGFTSEDRRLGQGPPPGQRRCFHLAGRSLLKGTRQLVEVWHEHPEWPPLVIVQHPETRLEVSAANVRYLSAVLSNDELRRWQTACPIHLCPSEAEGWGHYIVEAASVGALVVTTDAPPMNELIRPDRGLLVAATPTREHGLDRLHVTDPAQLTLGIERALSMPQGELRGLGESARAWFDRTHAAFGPRVNRVVGALLEAPRARP